MTFYWSSSLTYVVVMPFLSCLEFSLGLVYVGPLGCNGADFCPGPSVGVGWPCSPVNVSRSVL